MKKTLLKNEDSAKARGFYANWAFVTDKKMSPDGIDFMQCNTIEWRASGKKDYNKMPAELTVLQQDGTAIVYEGSTKELSELRSRLIGRTGGFGPPDLGSSPSSAATSIGM